MKTLGVVGLGYVGLPLAVLAASKGYKVIGIDLDERIVDLVNKRKSPFVNDVRFAKLLKELNKESLIASSNYDELKQVETIVICVPTPTENNVPDFTYVIKSVHQIAKQLQSGQFVALESTVNPGVTRDVALPILEKESGLSVGKDFYLAHCPERIDPGNKELYVGNINRVVGGITPECTMRALKFYKDIIDAQIIPLNSTEEAEFVKSWENSHRNVMIALANSAAIICDGVGMNIDNILRGLQSKVDQFGLSLAKPGIGPGGHCIPEDIHYVIKIARQNGIDTRLLDDAADLNDKMPRYAVQKLVKMIKSEGDNIKNLNVAVLGLAYKPNIADMRRSPSVEVCYQFIRKAKQVIVHDSFVAPKEVMIKGVKTSKKLEDVLKHADAVFIGTAHDEYVQAITPNLLQKYGIKYLVDGRNCLDSNVFLDTNIFYSGIGK